MVLTILPMSEIQGDAEVSYPIPNQFIFVWLGSKLPAFAEIAVHSALKNNPGSIAILYHDESFVPSAELEALYPIGLQLKVINIVTLREQVAALSPGLDTSRLERVYDKLKAPAARSNLVRLLALFVHGGVYLDTDTLTLKDMSQLRESFAFCGEECVLWPAGRSRARFKAITLGEIRRLCAAIPYAYRLNRLLLPNYALAANNAVLGAQRAHPFILALLEGVVDTPDEQLTKRFALGTHLLQRTLVSYSASRPSHSITVLSPEHFYPLGPMISRHYFGHYRSAQKVTEELVSPKTFVVHWYASVAQLEKRDASFIRKNWPHEVFSYLCYPFVGEHQPALKQTQLPAAISGEPDRSGRLSHSLGVRPEEPAALY